MACAVAFAVPTQSTSDTVSRMVITTRSGRRARTKHGRPGCGRIAAGAALIATVTLAACEGGLDKAREVRQPAWAGSSTSVVFDHHTHTRFSDGRLPMNELVDLAAASGCQAIAVSDHSDSPDAYSPAYLAALATAREAHPDLMLFAGLELEMPSYGGREHLGLVLSPLIERQLLPRIGAAVQAAAGVDSGAEADAILLREIRSFAADSSDALLIYNHPSRKDRNTAENLADFRVWTARSGRTLMLSGAPGHQAAAVPGDYRPPILTMDRWDPVVARVGGTWDRLLDEGRDVRAAIAASDFHNERKDFPPCTFARTRITVADPSYAALLDALNAGTFWAGHGDVLQALELSAEIDATLPLAYPGATVLLGATDSNALVRVSIRRTAGSAGLPFTADLISNCASGSPELVTQLPIAALARDARVFLPLAAAGADGRSCYLRSRLTVERGDERLAAYTNSIRFVFP